jgi:hypothetical protein
MRETFRYNFDRGAIGGSMKDDRCLGADRQVLSHRLQERCDFWGMQQSNPYGTSRSRVFRLDRSRGAQRCSLATASYV